ncbi:hypothetical protein YC2023_079955 [Brassica napus]
MKGQRGDTYTIRGQGRGKPKGRERVEFCLNSFHFVSFFSLSPQAISVAKEIVAIHTVFSYNRVRNPSNRTPRRFVFLPVP